MGKGGILGRHRAVHLVVILSFVVPSFDKILQTRCVHYLHDKQHTSLTHRSVTSQCVRSIRTVDVELVDDVTDFLQGWFDSEAAHDTHEFVLRDLTVLVFVKHVESFTKS